MPKSKNIEWSKWDQYLGVKSDNDIANLTGCTPDNVRHRRHKFSISPAFYSTWTDNDKRLLSENKLQCVTCHNIKSISEFRPYKNTKSGTCRTCKKCHNSIHSKKRIDLKNKFINLMGGKCQNCGYKSTFSGLQFHHVGNKKEYHICTILYDKNINKILKELEQCCLLCSNCHDAFHGHELQFKFIKRKDLGWTISSKT